MNSIGLNPRRRAAYKSLAQLAGLTALMCMPHFAQAAAVLTFYENNDTNQLVAVLSGSINTTGVTPGTGITNGPGSGGTSFVNGGNGLLAIYKDNNEALSDYALTPDEAYSSENPWPISFLGSHDSAPQPTSSTFIINQYKYNVSTLDRALRLSQDSTSGEELSAYLIWENTSFSDIGTSAGNSFGYSLTDKPVETITISFSSAAPPPQPSAVPLPAAAPLLLGALGGFGLLNRRRKQRGTSAAA